MATAYIVRHGAMRFLGEFQPQGNVEPERGQEVVLRTERGVEIRGRSFMQKPIPARPGQQPSPNRPMARFCGPRR